MEINGASAIVTGGASGIGAAVVRQLATKGAKVVVADLNADKGGLLAKEVGGEFVSVDVTDTAEIATRRAFGGQSRLARPDVVLFLLDDAAGPKADEVAFLADAGASAQNTILVISQADLIAAEDTRRLRSLAQRLDVEPRGRVIAFHEHNERERAAGRVDARVDAPGVVCGGGARGARG